MVRMRPDPRKLEHTMSKLLQTTDPEPQPGDGPDYHTEHAFWLARQTREAR